MSSAVHATARVCGASVDAALEWLTTAQGMARWNLGLCNPREVEPGLFTGHSRFDGSTGWVRVMVHAECGQVNYAVGTDAQRLAQRIQAQVRAGEPLGHAAGTCVVALLAWRTQAMSDERWQRLTATHETEIELIRAQLARPADSSHQAAGRPAP